MTHRPPVGDRAAWAGLALLICAAAPAHAARVEIDAVARPVVDKRVLRLVVRPGSSLPTDRPLRAALGEAGPTVELRDDGQVLDLVAGDGAWVGATEAAPAGGDTEIVVLDADGAELLRAVVPVDPTLADAWVGLGLEGNHVQVSLGGGNAMDPAAGPGTPAGATPGAAEAPPIPGAAAPALQADKGGAGFWALVGGLAGLAVGWLLRGRRRTPLPAPVSPGAPAAPGLVRIPPGELDATVADRAARGAVLLLPCAARRAAWQPLGQGRPLVRWLRFERPTARQVRQARTLLSATGPVTLVVDGLEALEPADPDEAPDAVLQELVQDGAVEVVLVQPPAQGGEST